MSSQSLVVNTREIPAELAQTTPEQQATPEQINFFFSLPEEEQQEILASKAFAPLALKQKLAASLNRVNDIGKDAESRAQEIQEVVGPQLDPQTKLNICLYPTELCRTSMFYPMSKNEATADREFIKDRVITDTNWGRLVYTGQKLSVYDEDFLMAFLVILNDLNKRVTVIEEGKTTYSYKGSLRNVICATGVKGNPGKDHYKRAIKSFERMMGSVIKMEITASTTRGGRKKISKDMTNLISHFAVREDEEEVMITINPYFYEIYSAKRFTQIDMQNRAKLNRPTAKAIYRFLSSHNDQSWYGDVNVLAEAINVSRLDKFEMKRTISNGIEELISKDLCDPSSKLEGSSVTLTLAGAKPTTRKAIKAKTSKPTSRRKK